MAHSFQTPAKKCVAYDEKFKDTVEYGKILDRYYIPIRYPDALTPPAIPHETYTSKDQAEAVDFSERITDLVKGGIKGIET